MFAGLIEEIGVVERLDRYYKSLRLSIRRPATFDDIRMGDSISLNGVCLTITKLDKDIIAFDVIDESLERTNLGHLRRGNKINLERALKIGERVGGHFVTGHIDYKAQIRKVETEGNNTKLEIALPKEYKRYIISKGAVAVDGVSLTVGEAFSDSFLVYLIPYTSEKTTLSLKRKGNVVNIEIDVLAKYTLDYKTEGKDTKVNMSFLKRHGFM